MLMRTGNTPQHASARLNHLFLVGVLIAVAIVVMAPFYSVSSSASPAFSQVKVPSGAPAKQARIGSLAASKPTNLAPWSSTFSSLLPIPQSSPEEIATFASDCTTPKTTFTLGETVCAKTVFVTETDRFVNWIDPNSNIAYGGPTTTPITNNTAQDFLYTPTIVGLWKVTIADPSDSSIVPTDFTVVPAPPIATYDSTCFIPKSDFVLGETVCAKASGVPTTLFPWHVLWL